MMRHLVFLLEERSAKEMLERVLPRLLLQDISYRFIVFEGKQDLEKQLVKRIRGYQTPGARFVVLRDQDIGECYPIKRRLMDLCRRGGHPNALVRIACRELESWYLADLRAVEKGLNISGLAKKQDKKKYRNPDLIHSPAKELCRLSHRKYQKIAGSRAIAPHLNLSNIRSNSFRVFIEGLRRISS